jgi:hypothetical protein
VAGRTRRASGVQSEILRPPSTIKAEVYNGYGMPTAPGQSSAGGTSAAVAAVGALAVMGGVAFLRVKRGNTDEKESWDAVVASGAVVAPGAELELRAEIAVTASSKLNLAAALARSWRSVGVSRTTLRQLRASAASPAARLSARALPHPPCQAPVQRRASTPMLEHGLKKQGHAASSALAHSRRQRGRAGSCRGRPLGGAPERLERLAAGLDLDRAQRQLLLHHVVQVPQLAERRERRAASGPPSGAAR